MKTMIIRSEAVAWMLLILCCPHSEAQTDNVRPGEQRFNKALYKSSHNSYERDESLAQQIDNYNVWQLELDIHYYDDEVRVSHLAPTIGSPMLKSFLVDMVRDSKTYTEKFTVIYLDNKDTEDFDSEGERRELKNIFRRCLGAPHIYPSGEFANSDQKRWPSYQELVRRGYYWAVIIDWNRDGGWSDDGDDNTFFYETNDDDKDSNNPGSNFDDNVVLCTFKGGSDSDVRDEKPGTIDDRWLYRVWPEADDCVFLNDAYWTKNIAKDGVNFVASNCVDQPHTFGAKTHSPSPLFVDHSSDHEWGTLRFPFTDLAAALDRASPMVPVHIKSGSYEVPRGIKFTKPVVLKAIGGTVTIRSVP